MKNFTLVLLFVPFFSIKGFSQIEKKTFLLGGSASASFSTGFGSNFNLSVKPNVGYFVTKRFCPGASVSMSFRKNYQSYSFTPFARYYFAVKEKRSFYGVAAASVVNPFKTGNVVCSLGLGHVWFLSKNIGFEAQISGTEYSGVYSLGAHFGLQIYLNCSKKEE